MPKDETQLRELVRTLRRGLNLVDLDDLRTVEEEVEIINQAGRLKDEEHREYVAKMAGYWIEGLRKEIEIMIYTSEKFLNLKSQNHEQDLMGRGSLNGLLLVWELFHSYEQEWEAIQEENKKNN